VSTYVHAGRKLDGLKNICFAFTHFRVTRRISGDREYIMTLINGLEAERDHPFVDNKLASRPLAHVWTTDKIMHKKVEL
jgi:hypothetical protein